MKKEQYHLHKFITTSIGILFFFFLFSCKESEESTVLTIDKRNDTLHVVTLWTNEVAIDSMLLPYPVYQFDYADLTGDNVPEVVIGVIKKTKYWQDDEKRIFIYHLFNGQYIRPLWLGSRVGNQLKDFKLNKDKTPATILTEEWANDSTIIRREYKMGGFGLKYVRE